MTAKKSQLKLKNIFNKLNSSHRLAFAVSLMIAGTILVVMIMAASGTFISIEPELGSKSEGVAEVIDPAASGGKSVKFAAPPLSACSGSPGAAAGSPTAGLTTYSSSGTTTVRNVIFDGSHADDLVRVYTGKVIFENVTFRGTGTGSSGHTLEIKQGGSAEVRNSIFEGSPAEDTIQTEGNSLTLIECNRIGGSPGEDHIDTKPGAGVTIRNNSFVSAATAQTLQNHNGTSPVNFENNTGVRRVFYESGQNDGRIVGNTISEYIWLYDVSNILVEGNTVQLVKHGDSGTRDPNVTYFKDNSITTFQFNGGSCYKSGSNGAALSQCTTGSPPWN